jgi:hypothetical protein
MEIMAKFIGEGDGKGKRGKGERIRRIKEKRDVKG